jgi:transcriptional regulator with XRE-family HTH domain
MSNRVEMSRLIRRYDGDGRSSRMATGTKRPGVTAVEIGGNLARIRKQKGVSQVELARQLGVPQQKISKYERGQLRLHGQVLVRLARILGVTSDVMLGLDNPSGVSASEDTRFLKRLQRIDRLSRRDKLALLRTLDAFLERAELKKSA